jgi:RNA recognition motif-containing protein
MTSIFVAKLDFNVTDDELKSLFEKHGKVNRVTIAKDKETGKPRGFAFVEMFNDAEADAAIEALDNYAINGRNIAVKKAEDRNAGNKPQGPRDNNRPAFKSNETAKKSFDSNSGEQRTSFNNSNNDERPRFESSEGFAPKVERKKEKDKPASNNDNPKKTKMSAYKKSGKDNRFFDEDINDDDENLDFYYKRNKDSGWDEDED